MAGPETIWLKENMALSTPDYAPFFRNSVGLDRLHDLVETALQIDRDEKSYPPYNIEQVGDGGYRITIAVAGFGESDLDVMAKENSFVVTGKLPKKGTQSYIYRGIAGQAFESRFDLAKYIKVTGASLGNGLRQVELSWKVMELKKARKITISNNSLLHSKAA